MIFETSNEEFKIVLRFKKNDFSCYNRFFSHAEDTRQARRIKQAEIRENGRQEALKRGKCLDENGKVINRII